jgi:hypothetical protein
MVASAGQGVQSLISMVQWVYTLSCGEHPMQEKPKQQSRSDNRTTSTRKNIRFNNDLLESVESAKGSQSFAMWVQDACRDKLKADNA